MGTVPDKRWEYNSFPESRLAQSRPLWDGRLTYLPLCFTLFRFRNKRKKAFDSARFAGMLSGHFPR